MLYVKSVKSNLKGGVSAELGPRTLITGPVGAGKSAIVNAIELALTGRVSDIVGRADVAAEAQLMQLAPPEGCLLAQATLSDGRTASYEALPGKRAKVSPISGLSNILPLRAVREAVAGSPDAARRFFLVAAGADLTRADVLARIPAPLRKLYEDLASVDGYAIDQLLSVAEAAREKTRAKHREVKAAKEMMNAVSQGLPARPSESELQSASEEITILADELEGAIAAATAAQQSAGAASRLVTNRAALDDAERRMKAAWERWHAADAALAALPPPDENAARRAAFYAALRYSADNALPECATCGSQVDPAIWPPRVQFVESRIESRRVEGEQRFSVESALASARFDYEVVQDEVAKLRRHVESLAAAEPAAADPAALVDQVSRLRAQHAEAQSHYITLREAGAKWTAVERAQSQATLIEQAAVEYEQLAKACDAAVGALLESAAARFAARVQAHLPEGDVFKLQLREGDKAICRFGLERNGRLHSALSGVEWARVTVALALATAGDSPLKIIVPEDRAWDPESLAAVMEALQGAPAQVIIATTTRPSRNVEGWTVIDRGAVAGVVADAPPAAVAAPASARSRRSKRAEPAQPAPPQPELAKPAPESGPKMGIGPDGKPMPIAFL